MCYITEQVMDWDRFKADEEIGVCRVELHDLSALMMGEPRALQIVQPESNASIVGKDHCHATLTVSFSLAEPKGYKGEEVPHQPANVSSIDSTAQPSFSSAQGEGESLESGHGGARSSWSTNGLTKLPTLQLGSSTNRSQGQSSVASPRNVFDSILFSMDTPRGEDLAQIVVCRSRGTDFWADAEERVSSGATSDLRPFVLGASAVGSQSNVTQDGAHGGGESETGDTKGMETRAGAASTVEAACRRQKAQRRYKMLLSLGTWSNLSKVQLTRADFAGAAQSSSEDDEDGGLKDGVSKGVSHAGVSSEPIIITSSSSQLVSSKYEYY
jgi:hypothetical protein